MAHLRRGAVPAIAPALIAAVLATGQASAAPPGDPAVPEMNQWSSCRPSPKHPRPVVLVHGNGSGLSDTWTTLAAALSRDGYCVFGPEYGRHTPGSGENLLDVPGGTDIRDSARMLATFVGRVRAATGTSQVDIVGHSMGALTARQYLKVEGGADGENPSDNVVHTLITLGGTNQGTTFDGNKALRDQAASMGLPADDAIAAAVGPAYSQQMAGSSFIDELNTGGDTLPGVEYVAVASTDDGIITPPDSAFLTAGDGASVQNVWVQDGCPGLDVDHMGLTTTPRALWLVQNALDPGHRTQPGPCP